MNMQQFQDYFELKTLVDIFSNLADEKNVAAQMPLFSEEAQVTTYMGEELFANVQGRADIERVFSDFLANFERVYHLNGQQTIASLNDETAEAIVYCLVKLVERKAG